MLLEAMNVLHLFFSVFLCNGVINFKLFLTSLNVLSESLFLSLRVLCSQHGANAHLKQKGMQIPNLKGVFDIAGKKLKITFFIFLVC